MNHQINLLHLKYFCDAVVQNSVSEAARMNYVSQSAVSQAISKLEISLSVSLVSHARQRFKLTEEGRVVFEQARHIFKAVQDIHHKISQKKGEVTGTVKFASTNSLGMSFIAPSYKAMNHRYPHIPIHYQLGNLNFIRNSLRQGTAEFAIVVYDETFDQFQKRKIHQGRFHLYQHVKASHHLIENGILVDHKAGMHVENLYEYFMQHIHSSLKIQAELAGWEVVARFTEMNIGLGFFPDYLMANNRYSSLTIYPIDIPSLEYEICAIYNKDISLSCAALTFLELFSLES